MTFDEWLKLTYPSVAGGTDELFLRQAWDEATKAAIEVVQQTAKRYTCKTRKALLRAVAEQIKQGAAK